MHPRVRGLGQPPRDQRADRIRSGERPLLQGHLKPAKRGQRPPASAPASDAEQPPKPAPAPEDPPASKA